MRVEAKLEELGLVLPEPMQVGPPGLRFPFAWVRARQPGLNLRPRRPGRLRGGGRDRRSSRKPTRTVDQATRATM
jgi:hypothetical protein